MDENGIREPDGPPPLLTAIELASYCRVDWARNDRVLRFVSQVDRPRGIYLHWEHKGSKLCPTSLDPDAPCERCQDKKSTKGWYAVLLGTCWDTFDTVLALLPEVSYRRAESKLTRGSLFNRHLTYSRAHAYSTVKVEIAAARQTIQVAHVNPEEFLAIVEHVYARMGINQRKERSE